MSRHLRHVSLVAAAAVLVLSTCSFGADSAPTQAVIARDGAHDFDFDFGVWHNEITRRLHPLADSTESMKLSGTVTIRKVWGGKAQLEEIEVDGPKGHWEGMSLLYDCLVIAVLLLKPSESFVSGYCRSRGAGSRERSYHLPSR